MLTLITAILAQRYQSAMVALVCALCYTWTGVCGHNYFHQRDNWRMRYFNLLFMNYRDWRVSHALAHHLYPNTLLDMESMLFEPFFVYKPFKDAKNWMQRYGSVVYTPLVFLTLYPLAFLTK